MATKSTHKFFVILTSVHMEEQLGALAWEVEPWLFRSRKDAQKYIDDLPSKTICKDDQVTIKEFRSANPIKKMNVSYRIREIYSFEDAKKCQKCGSIYFGTPALSREDNITEICSQCGLEEALDAYKNEKGGRCVN